MHVRLEFVREFWHMHAEFFHDGRSAPHEDATIPQVLLGSNKLSGDLCRRFLSKPCRLADERGCGDRQGVARLNVAIARSGKRGLHPKRHQQISVLHSESGLL